MATVTRELDEWETLEAGYAAAYLVGFHRHSDDDIRERVTKVYDFLHGLTKEIDEDAVWKQKQRDEDDDDGDETTYELTMTVRVKVIATSKMEAAERAESTAFWQDWNTLTFPYDIEKVA